MITRLSIAFEDFPGSSIAKDLIDSEDPKHTLFCRETAFVAIYVLFQLSIEQKSYRKNRKAIERTEKLSIEQKSYQ